METKEFKLSNFFDIEKVKGINKDKLTEPKNKTYDYITRTSQNNGIESITGSIPNKDPLPAKTFSLGLLQMTFFYRPREWYAGQFVRIIKPKFDINRERMLYMLTLLKKIAPKLQAVLVRYVDDTFNNTAITLPITPTGQPDWDYMETYIRELEADRIRELEADRIRELEAYLKVTGLSDTTLTDKDRAVLKKMRDGEVVTKEFKIGELFEKKTVKGFTKSKFQNQFNNPDDNGYYIYGQNIKRQYPFKIKLPEKYLFKLKNKQPILAFASSTGSVNIITEDFYRSGDNGAFQALIPKKQINKEAMLFILTNTKKIFKRFSYNTQINNIPELKLTLPVTPSDQPDFTFMHDYIRAIEKLTIQKLNSFRKKQINTTKTIVNANEK